MPSHQDDPLRAEPLGCQHRGQPDRTVADHRHHAPGSHPGRHRAVVPGRENIRKSHQGRQQNRVLADGELDQRPLRERDPHSLALTAVHAPGAEEAAVPTGRVQPGAAVFARVVRVGERRHHDLAGRQSGHFGAEFLDHAEELVPDPVPSSVAGRDP